MSPRLIVQQENVAPLDYTAPLPTTQQKQKVQDGYNAMRQYVNPKASQVTPAQAKFIAKNGGFLRGIAAMPDMANMVIERYAPPVSRYPFLSPAGNKIADWIYPQQTGGYTGEY